MALAETIHRALGPDARIAVTAYDGSSAGPADPVATIHVRSKDALRRVLTARGDLGIGRAYVAGDIDLDGDALAAIGELHGRALRVDPLLLKAIASELGRDAARLLPAPPEEVRVHGRRHSRTRDEQAVRHHYDVSNEFYGLVLGPTMTYSCALWERPDVGLDAAQEAKVDLVCRKLALEPGMRLLDVGCGWGTLVLHAARHYGVRAVGITLSPRQAELANQRAKEAGLDELVEVRVQDERDITDGPFDAIASVGMFEHVGRSRLSGYFDHLHALLRPGGRLLNHGITRPAQPRDARAIRLPAPPWQRRTFIDRFVFPDGELHEVGDVISVLQQSGLELRHVESLREHYALTLRAWVANLEQHWDDAVAEGGEGRARVWRLYMAASAINFERNHSEIHQALAVKPMAVGRSGFPLRPAY